MLLPVSRTAGAQKEDSHEGLHRTQGQPWYAVVYEGIDPGNGRERRKWHPAGTDRAAAERLAARLAAELEGRNDDVRSLTFGAYLTARWSPAKRVLLAETTYDATDHPFAPAQPPREPASGC